MIIDYFLKEIIEMLETEMMDKYIRDPDFLVVVRVFQVEQFISINFQN